MPWTAEEQARARKAAQDEMARLFPQVGKCEGKHRGCRLRGLCRCLNSACNCNAGCYSADCRLCYPEGTRAPVRRSRSSGRMSSSGASSPGDLAGALASSMGLAAASLGVQSGGGGLRALRATASSASASGGSGSPTAMAPCRMDSAPAGLLGASSGGLGTRASSSGLGIEASELLRGEDSSSSSDRRGALTASLSGLRTQSSGALGGASSRDPRGRIPRSLPRGGGGSQRSDAGTELLPEAMAELSLSARSARSTDPGAQLGGPRGSKSPSRSGEQGAGSRSSPRSKGGNLAASGPGHSLGSGRRRGDDTSRGS